MHARREDTYMAVLIRVTDATFQTEVLSSAIPVLVDFWAEWCGPCRHLAPALEDLASEYADQLRVAQVDIDVNRETTMAYGVMSIPTLKLFKDGVVVHTLVGAKSKPDVLTELRAHLPLGNY
jgi:thioredoxin 1